MSNEIKINFYEEIIVLNILNKAYKDFKQEISKRYGIEVADVNELTIYYFDLDKVKYFIKNENDYNILIGLSKKFTATVFLEIHEESRLFKNQGGGNPFSVTNSSSNISAEKLRLEILEKEKLLKDTIEKERLEIQKKKEEAKRKMDEENKKKKLEELRRKKQLMEKEEEERKRKEKEELESEVSRLMNENIDKIKKAMIESTVNQSLNIVDKQLEKRLEMSKCKDVHYNYTCTGCGMSPIVGIRYSCGISTDFHLCENCEYFIGETHPYPLLKYRSNKQGGLKIKMIIEGSNTNKNTNFNNDFNNNFNFGTNKDKTDDCVLLEELNKVKK